jgi:hypothetical protein
MATADLRSLMPDPMLLPPREASYLLRATYELVDDGFREELIFDWGDSYLVVRVDGDTDTLHAEFQAQPFTATEAYSNASACPPWDRFVGKECDWTWVALNKQGYCDLFVFSFDAVLPQVLLHALTSSIEIFTIAQERQGGHG